MQVTSMRKVLVIEDNPDNLELISLALRRSGYEVLSAETGEEGRLPRRGNLVWPRKNMVEVVLNVKSESSLIGFNHFISSGLGSSIWSGMVR